MTEKAKTRGIFEKVAESGVYWIRYTDGSAKYRREIAGTYAQAVKLLAKRRTEALQRRKLPETLRQPVILFSQLCEDALHYSEQHKRSYRDDRSRMVKLKEWFGSREAASLSAPEIEERLSEAAAAERWASSTYNHYRSLMMLVFREARRAGKISTNPARDVRHRREDNSRVRFLDDAEETRLREVIRDNWPEHLPEFDLAISTGLRKASMYSLTWGMVDWTGRMLNLPTSKTGEPLHIPLNAAALAALRTVHQHGATGRVFQSLKTGKPLENGRHWFDGALEKSKIVNFHWHDLRHHFASKLRQRGAKLEDIAELLAHKSLTMTKRYAHLGPNQLHDVASLLDPVSTTVAPTPKAQERVSASYLN